MNNTIKISKPYFEEEKEKIKIYSIIESDKEDYKLWFEVQKEYKQYLICERLDAFIIAILPYAIKKQMDIHVQGALSSKLYYQLTTYLIPLLCDKFNKRIIKIEASLDSNIYNIAKAVGTGISCGVDSLYTISKHINRKEKEFNITHLTFFNAGASGKYGGEEARKLYRERMKFAKQFAEENNLKFVSVDTNMNEFLMMDHEMTHTFRSLACVLLMQKLFSKYYYSSGLEFDETRIAEYDSACYDILNVQCLSTEDTTFYSTGMESTRIGKVKEIVKYVPSYEHLNVCIFEDKNCGECEKCIRTLLELDSIGKLDLYNKVFNIQNFNKNKNKYLIFMLKKMRQKNIFYKEIYREYKKRRKNIPIYLKIISFIPNKEEIKNIIFKILPKDKLKRVLKKQSIKDGWTD